jgi:CHAD domain-containing protein
MGLIMNIRWCNVHVQLRTLNSEVETRTRMTTTPTPLPPSDPPSAPKPAKPTLLDAARARHAVLSSLLARGPTALSDPDFIHDLRVASRRAGEAARLLRPFSDKPTAKAVASCLRGLRRAMGDLRDADVTRQHLVKGRMPAPLRHIARDIAAGIEAARPNLVAAAQTQMTSASLIGTMVILARLLEDRSAPELLAETERTFRETLHALIARRRKQLRRAFGQAAKKQTAASLHAARIAGKKLRYLLELAADAGTLRGAKKQVAFLKRLQQLLGDHHDTHVLAEQLAAHLHTPRPKPLKNLAPAWRKWHRRTTTLQSRRAALFFARTYAWINQ